MEIVRFAGLIYRSTKIPASHVALLSSIQVNDRADVALLGASGFSLMSSPAPRSGLSRSDLVHWPMCDPTRLARPRSGYRGTAAIIASGRQIPIVAAPPTIPHRDFVPWRFSDAGRRSAWLASWVPASENLRKEGKRGE